MIDQTGLPAVLLPELREPCSLRGDTWPVPTCPARDESSALQRPRIRRPRKSERADRTAVDPDPARRFSSSRFQCTTEAAAAPDWARKNLFENRDRSNPRIDARRKSAQKTGALSRGITSSAAIPIRHEIRKIAALIGSPDIGVDNQRGKILGRSCFARQPGASRTPREGAPSCPR